MKISGYKGLFFPTLISYIVLCFLLAGNQWEGKTVFEFYCGIFGGIRAGILSDNLMKLMQWLLSILPLLVFLGMQISEELSGRLYITVIRSKSIRRWWNSWVRFSLLLAGSFSLAVFLAAFLTGVILGEGAGLGSEVGMLFQVFCVNAIYNCTLSVVLVSLGLWLRNLKWSMVVILAIVMTSYVLGKFFPAMTPFLVGTYSMANRLRISDNCYGVDGWIAVTILLLLAGIAYFVGIIGAKKVLYRMND